MKKCNSETFYGLKYSISGKACLMTEVIAMGMSFTVEKTEVIAMGMSFTVEKTDML